MRAKQFLDSVDGLNRARNQWKAVSRIADGWGQYVGERPGAVIAQHGEPGTECAWHGGGQQPNARHLFESETAKVLRAGQCRGRSLATNGEHAAFALAPQQDGDFSARAVQMRLHYLQDKASGDGRIKSVSTAFQYAHRGLRCEPMGRGCDSKGAGDFGARGELVHKNLT